MTREEALRRVKGYLTDYLSAGCYGEVEEIMEALEQTPKTWGLDDAREDFMSDVYNTLAFLPTNNEANRIIDSFDRVTSGLNQQPCEGCISREDALMALTGDITDCTIEEFIARLRDKLSKLPSVTPKEKTGWIPVSERLPEKGKQVLCCNKQGSVFTSTVTYIGKYYDRNTYVCFGQHCNVIAWMPLPEPYKAESEEEE